MSHQTILTAARQKVDETPDTEIQKELLARLMVQNEILYSNLSKIKGQLTFFIIVTCLSLAGALLLVFSAF